MMIKKVASPGGYGEPQVLCLAHIQAASLSLVPGDLISFHINITCHHPFLLIGLWKLRNFEICYFEVLTLLRTTVRRTAMS